MAIKELSPETLAELKADNKRIVMIYGDFNVLHPGHFRFIRFAAEHGDVLIVGMNDQACSDGAFLPNEERWEALACLDMIDHLVLVEGNLEEKLSMVQPQIVVKGTEWQGQVNEEETLLKDMGCRLIFSSGERFSSSMRFDQHAEMASDWLDVEPIAAYMRRHEIAAHRLQDTLERFSKLKVAVLGDLIVDEYHDCLPVGMSREDPTIVVKPQTVNRYLGGAGIVAAHASGLGANVDFYSVAGRDDAAAFASETLGDYQVKPTMMEDDLRPTTVKRRYRATGKTLLRVNDFSEQDMPVNLREKLLYEFFSRIAEYDLVVFSDFNYGALPGDLVDRVSAACREHNVPYVADSQSSSQVGDLNKFSKLLLVTPTEHEARLTINNSQDGLVQVSANLGDQLETQHLLVTLGEDGVLIRTKLPNGSWDTDDLPALNNNPVDPAGAGDAMLTATSMALCSGADLWSAALLGSCASALQVNRVGNVPLNTDALNSGLLRLFS